MLKNGLGHNCMQYIQTQGPNDSILYILSNDKIQQLFYMMSGGGLVGWLGGWVHLVWVFKFR